MVSFVEKLEAKNLHTSSLEKIFSKIGKNQGVEKKEARGEKDREKNGVNGRQNACCKNSTGFPGVGFLKTKPTVLIYDTCERIIQHARFYFVINVKFLFLLSQFLNFFKLAIFLCFRTFYLGKGKE